MSEVLVLEFNSQQMLAEIQKTNQLLESMTRTTTQAGRAADEFGQKVQGGSRAMASFTINSLQAVNNATHIVSTFRSIAQGSTALAAGIGSIGVEVGLLAGNFIHLAAASAQAGGQTGLGGLLKQFATNPTILITAGVIALSQAVALFSGNTKKALEESRGFFQSLGGLGEAGLFGFGQAEASSQAISALRKRQFERSIVSPLSEGKGINTEVAAHQLFNNASPVDLAEAFKNATGLLTVAQQTTHAGILLGSKLRGAGPNEFTGQDLESIISYKYRTDLQTGAGSFLSEGNRRAGLSDRDRNEDDFLRRFRRGYGTETETGIGDQTIRDDFRFQRRAGEIRSLSDDLGSSLTSTINVDMWRDWESAGINAIKNVANTILEFSVTRPLAQFAANAFANLFAPVPPGTPR